MEELKKELENILLMLSLMGYNLEINKDFIVIDKGEIRRIISNNIRGYVIYVHDFSPSVHIFSRSIVLSTIEELKEYLIDLL